MELLSPGVVLVAYAEPLLEGRRVVVFGDATSSLAAELIDRGARTVHVYDPEPARAAVAASRNRSKQISVVPLDEADVAVRDGAFDVAIVEDLSAAGEPAALLKRVRRAVAQRGTAIVASPNPDSKFSLIPRTSASRTSSALGYYELYDAVSTEFAEVRMLGQTPFVGYAVVDFAPDGEPEVSIDSGLVPGGAEEPEWFVALASRDAQENDSFAIVQLPAARVVTNGVDEQLAADLRAARANEARLVEQAAAAQVELSELRGARHVGAGTERERAANLEQELVKQEGWIRELEARATAANARATEARTELEALREQNVTSEKASAERDALAAEVAALSSKLSSAASEKTEALRGANAMTADKTVLAKQLTALGAEKTNLAKQLAALGTEKANLAKQLAALGAEKADLAKKLAALGTENADLAKQLAALKLAGTNTALQGETAVKKLQQQILERDAKLKELTAAVVPSSDDETTRLEAGLRERGERVRRLEADLREAERVGKELVRELRVTPAVTGADSNGADPKALSVENARLVADLAAAGWTIQELESRVSELGP